MCNLYIIGSHAEQVWVLMGVVGTESHGCHKADSRHLLDPAVGQVDEVLSLGAVAVPGLLLSEIVAAVVVLQYGNTGNNS